MPEFLLARRGPEGGLRPAGSASLGLNAQRRAELLKAAAPHAVSASGRRGPVRWVNPVVEVLADVHGPVDGGVRDAIWREVFLLPASVGRGPAQRLAGGLAGTDSAVGSDHECQRDRARR